MDHPQQKAWTMKHPALAKAFAVVLAVMSVVLLFAGINSFGEAGEENESRLRYEKRYTDRINNYVELSEKLENSISYDEAYAELEKLLEQHEDDASQHKTDLALYSAEKGGNTMGANMIWEAMPAIKGAKFELEAGKAALLQQEEQLNMVLQNEVMIRSASSMIAYGQSGVKTMIGQLEMVIKSLEAAAPPASPVPTDEPVVSPVPTDEPVVSPVPTDEPVVSPVPTDEPVVSPGPTDEPVVSPVPTDEPVVSPVPTDEPVVSPGPTDEPVVSPGPTDEPAVSPVASQMPVNEEGSAENKAAALQSGSQLMYSKLRPSAVKRSEQTGLEQPNANVAIWKQIEGMIPAVNQFVAMVEGMKNYPGMEAVPVPDRFEYISITSDEEAVAAANGLIATLNAVDGSFAYVNQIIGPMLEIINNKEATLAMLEAGKAQLAAGEKALKMGEHEMQKALEDIWYNLGELEKDRVELEKRRDELNEEAAVLSKQIVDTDELHELENRHVSAKLLLTSVKEVNDMVEAGGEIVPSAEKHLEGYKAETEKLYTGKIISSILAVIGGIAGLAAVPAAYELIKKRFWLIVPVVVSVICAAASETVYYISAKEMWYVGLFAAIIALLHLLVVLPKEKRPGEVTKT